MNAIRRWAIGALCVGYLHVVFGAIVRISGSGMGCGKNWPKCYGSWLPAFDRPELVIEFSHRFLASILTITVCIVAFIAWRKRHDPNVAGRGGPLRSAAWALGFVLLAATFGAITVDAGNAPWATVAHLCIAMGLLGFLLTTVIRAGGLGAASLTAGRGTGRAKRAGIVAAAMAFITVAMGGLTAKFPGAPIACGAFPLCGYNPLGGTTGAAIQITHRVLAFLLFFHLIGVVMGMSKRGDLEASAARTAGRVALGFVILQLCVAGAMIGMHLPAPVRSLHEATGVAVWLSCFSFAYLATRAAPSSKSSTPDRPVGRVNTIPLRTASR